MRTGISALLDQKRQYAFSKKSPEQFFRNHKKLLKKIRIGTSFSPEHVEELFTQDGKGVSQEMVMNVLRYAVEVLHMKEIRLGMRWNMVDNGKRVDISYYKPFLEYCFKNKVNICLNVGPIKTFRWPEQYVPKYILSEKTKLPQKGGVIESDSFLAKKAYAYLEKLLRTLVSSYTPAQLYYITSIQPENEPFHKFGVYEWIMSDEYLHALTEIILKYFPRRKIVLSSSETRNVEQVIPLFKKMDLKRGQAVCGINYYFKVPGTRSLPCVGPIDYMLYSHVRNKNPFSEQIKKMHQSGIGVEVVEGQAEIWKPMMSPGNDYKEFQYLLLRCAENIVFSHGDFLIRMWGIERLAKNFLTHTETQDHRSIQALIQAINNQ